MKKNFLNRILTASLVVASVGTFAQSPTSPALDFNVFLENNAQLVNNETEGPFALGGDLNINGSYQVSINDPGTFYVGGVRVTMVVGGRINYTSGGLQVNQSGYIKIGNCIGSTVWYTDPNGAHPPIRITPTTNYNSSPRILLQTSSTALGVSASYNPVCQPNVIDFASAFTAMRSYSDVMKDFTDNASLTNSAGATIPHTGLPTQVKLTVNPGLNVLNVSGADLNAVNDFIYNNNPDPTKYLIINVNAPGTFNWSVYNSGAIGLAQCPYILYNFYNTTTLNIVGYGAIEGTVFAPYADIVKTSNSANVEGQIIAKSYHHAGGENHYAVFSPTIPGCGGPIAPDASYTVNDNNQCLTGNNFVFTSGSTGSGPLTYLWTFGDGTTSTAANPSVSYTATGTYNVKLRVTNSVGVDSVIHSVIVSGNPVYGYSINDTVQALTGNSFTFTSVPPTTGNIYSWDFGNGATSTDVNPTTTYATAGVYTVTQRVTGSGGCTVDVVNTVVVESDSVGGGGGGGLESESLGDLVSKRAYNKIKNSISSRVDYSTLPLFHKEAAYAAAKASEIGSSLSRFIPETLNATTVAKITSPEDLTKITKAVDAFSVDYTENNTPKAVILAITTTGKAYNHTKSICDRFRGAELLTTKQVTINGYKFIEFALRQGNGEVEHSITFATGKTAGTNHFNLQSKWLISEYSGDDSIFNFQVWGTTPASVEKLTADLLNNLGATMPLQQTDVNFTLPPAYIAIGQRNKENLEVNIAAVRSSNNAKVVFIQKINEEASEDSLIIPFNLVAGRNNHFSIPIFDGYEYEGHFYLDDTLVDDVYMADGAWSLDFDKTYTSILNYKPNNNFNRVYNNDELPLYRNVMVNATTKDYISIYKFIRAGQEKTDLSDFHSYKFFAEGNGTMIVRLIKESVTKFADQYKTNVTLEPNGKNYQISFDDFTSDNLEAPFDPSDVTAVVYTFEFHGIVTEFHFYADEQSFSPTVVNSIKALSNRKVTIYPNPTSGSFNLGFASEADRNLDLTFTDVAGRVIYKQSVAATIGQNKLTIQLPASLAQSVVLVQLGDGNIKYGVTKLSILK